MLRVKVKVVESPLQGKGIVAVEFIPKGTVTWQYDPGIDIAYDSAEIEALGEEERVDLMRYLYFDFKLNKFILCSDDQKYINHSGQPNIMSKPEQDVAARDIEPGEELVCNYEDYESGWFDRRDVKKEDFS